jgi:hypothetical protein
VVWNFAQVVEEEILICMKNLNEELFCHGSTVKLLPAHGVLSVNTADGHFNSGYKTGCT